MNNREAFEASVTKLGIVASFEKHVDGNYKNMQIQYLSAIWGEALASQAQQPVKITADSLWNNEKLMSINAELGLSMDSLLKIADAMQSQAQQHSDDIAVDHFAAAMKAKLAKKREQGRGGWSNKEECSEEHLQGLLLGHVAKGDPVDVGNFAMMLFNRGERTQFPIEAQQTESQWISVDERLPEMETPVVAMVGKNIYALARVDYDEGWLWAICGSDLSDIRDYEADDDYQPTYWMPLVIPPAPDVCSDGGKCGSGGYCITCPNVPAPEGGDK